MWCHISLRSINNIVFEEHTIGCLFVYIFLIKIELWSNSHFIILNSRLQRISYQEHYHACAVVEHQLHTLPDNMSSYLCLSFSYFFWPLYCLSFFDLRLLITLFEMYLDNSTLWFWIDCNNICWFHFSSYHWSHKGTLVYKDIT